MKLLALFMSLISTSLWANEILVEQIETPSFSKIETLAVAEQSFISQQKELIKDKQLKLWGVGLFSGSEAFSLAIQAATATSWSHVTLILVDQYDQKYCYQSNGDAMQILIQHILPQVQIDLWDDVVKNYSGRKIAIRQFKFTDDSHNDPAIITPYVTNMLGTPYEKDIKELISSIFRANTKEGLKSVFCSEEAAKLLIKLNYLSSERLADNYLPRDFTDKEFIPLQGCSLGKQVLVKENQGCCTIL